MHHIDIYILLLPWVLLGHAHTLQIHVVPKRFLLRTGFVSFLLSFVAIRNMNQNDSAPLK